MPSTKQFWFVLAVAILQAVLGGVVLVTHSPSPDSIDETAVERGDEPVPEVIDGPPGTVPAGVAPTDAVAPSADSAAPAASAGVPRSASPTTGGGAPKSSSSRPAPDLEIVSTYEELNPDEQRSVAGEPPYEAVVEGRLPQGWYWRLSAHDKSGDKVCADTRLGKRGIPGSGAGGLCRERDHWEIQVMSVGDSQGDFVIVTAYATVDAPKFRLIAKGGDVGEVEGRFESAMGISFFVAAIACPAADLERLEALTEEGRVVSTLRFGEDSPGQLSFLCRP